MVNGRFLGATIAFLVAGCAVDDPSVGSFGSAVSWSRTGELRAPDPDEGDLFGASVAIDGDTAVVGAPGDDQAIEDGGAAYVFVRGGSGWAFQAKIMAPDPYPMAEFGSAVAVEGDRVLVGAPLDGVAQGAAYMFARNGATWIFEAQLAPSAGNFESWGAAVALKDGVAYVGAPGWPDGSNIGLVSTYQHGGSSWVADQSLTNPDTTGTGLFGASLDTDGQSLVIGAPSSQGGMGAAYVTRRDPVTGLGPLVGLDFGAAGLDRIDDAVGNSVGVEGGLVVVGAPGTRDGDVLRVGLAYLFAYDGTTWVHQDDLRPATAGSDSWTGWSVATGGGVVAVAAVAGFGEAVHLFELQDQVWHEDPEPIVPPSNYFNFGNIDIRGGQAIVGASGDNGGGTAPDSGSAYVFSLDTACSASDCPNGGDGGCGCRAQGGGSAGLLVVVVVVLLGRRRRR